jgi:hypothetical protein
VQPIRRREREKERHGTEREEANVRGRRKVQERVQKVQVKAQEMKRRIFYYQEGKRMP